MKKITLKIVDTSMDHVGPFSEWISMDYDIEWVDANPDFIIHSCFGNEVLKYDGVRISILGENILPDFNISDYAFGSSHMSLGDRYHRLPQYRLYQDYKQLLVNELTDSVNRSRFCTCVVSNANRNRCFFEVFEALNQYKEISSGGRWNNNVGGPVENKDDFLRTGKFSMVFETSRGSGYVTEKIMQTIISGAIPIYWGAADIGKDFNVERMVNCNDFDNVEGLVKRVVEIDQNDELYRNLLQQPVFPDGNELECNKEEVIRSKIRQIFSQTRDQAYRRNLEFWGEKYQNDQCRAFYQPHIQI